MTGCVAALSNEGEWRVYGVPREDGLCGCPAVKIDLLIGAGGVLLGV